MKKVINQSICICQFDLVDNSDLILFYASGFMQENVYYDKAADTYVIAELEDSNLLIHAIFSEKEVAIEDIIKAFGRKVTNVTLGFTPMDIAGFQCEEIRGQDTELTLFVKGDFFADFSERHLMFPTLSHA